MNFSIDRKGILPSQLTNRNGMFNNISAIQHNNIQRNFNKHINNKNSSQNRNIQEVSNNNNNNIIPIISNKHESIDIKILYIFTSLYTLAIAKEMLASVRGKYSSVPIPGAEVTTNAGDLRSEAASEKTALIDELKLMLEESSRSKYLERQSNEAQNVQDTLSKVPYPIYIY